MGDDFAEIIRKAGTGGPNFGLDTEGIVAQLKEWEKVCAFRVVSAERDRVGVEFDSLPADMETFVRGLYKFCPDLVDQGTGCVHEYVEMMEETGSEIPEDMKKLIAGVDFSDEEYGLEILRREIVVRKKVCLWWD